MTQTELDNSIAELGLSLGIAGLCFDNEAKCQLIFDQHLVVTMIHDRVSASITLNCPVCQADQFEGLSRHTLIAMLEANFMSQGCPKATLSFAQNKRAYLQTSIPLNASLQSNLRGALELLLNHAETWSERMRQNYDLNRPGFQGGQLV